MTSFAPLPPPPERPWTPQDQATHWSTGDEARLDYLVNVEGIPQQTASRMLWAPHLIPTADTPTRTAWVRLRTRDLRTAIRLGHVAAWLGKGTA